MIFFIIARSPTGRQAEVESQCSLSLFVNNVSELWSVTNMAFVYCQHGICFVVSVDLTKKRSTKREIGDAEWETRYSSRVFVVVP